MDTFKQTILNTACIKTLEIFPSARELLSIETSASRSVPMVSSRIRNLVTISSVLELVEMG